MNSTTNFVPWTHEHSISEFQDLFFGQRSKREEQKRGESICGAFWGRTRVVKWSISKFEVIFLVEGVKERSKRGSKLPGPEIPLAGRDTIDCGPCWRCNVSCKWFCHVDNGELSQFLYLTVFNDVVHRTVDLSWDQWSTAVHFGT